MKLTALILFILMYVLMIAAPKYRPYIALVTAVAFLAAGILPVSMLASVINWNVLLMIAGTMVIVYYFIDSGMPALLADILLSKSENAMWVTIRMSLFAGIISAFIDNVSTVLIVAPIALAICRKLRINPVGMILSVSVSSNLQGAATLVGDTTSIMLGDYAGMNFMDFFWMHGRPGIFFAVELGALATIPVMFILFRNFKEKITSVEMTEVHDYLPTAMLILMVGALITASFIPDTPSVTNGVICCTLAVITIIIDTIRDGNTEDTIASVMTLDFGTLGLLTGLFVVIGGLTNTGIINDFADLIVKAGGNDKFLLYTIIVWGSVLISAFVDNIPFAATMVPVIKTLSTAMGIDLTTLAWTLSLGTDVGGSATPIGASANVVGISVAAKNGYLITWRKYCKYAAPATIISVAMFTVLIFIRYL